MPAAPISLYIDLEPNRTAEIESVARASLEFAAGIREAAFLIDPSFEFRIELLEGEQSSLWLKAKLKWLRGLGHAHPTMAAVTLYAAGWFSGQTIGYGYEALLDAVFKSEDAEIVRLEPAQAEDIARRVAKLTESRAPDQHFRNVYRALQPDEAVRGVGAAAQNERKPSIIVPRKDFEQLMLPPASAAPIGRLRTRPESGDYVIIRPVLKEGGGKWRLRGAKGEVSATIADDDFYNDILSGSVAVPLAAEIHMKADVEVREQQIEEGAWKPVDYRVVKVHSTERQARQTPLPFPPN